MVRVTGAPGVALESEGSRLSSDEEPEPEPSDVHMEDSTRHARI